MSRKILIRKNTLRFAKDSLTLCRYAFCMLSLHKNPYTYDLRNLYWTNLQLIGDKQLPQCHEVTNEEAKIHLCLSELTKNPYNPKGFLSEIQDPGCGVGDFCNWSKIEGRNSVRVVIMRPKKKVYLIKMLIIITNIILHTGLAKKFPWAFP